MMWGFSHNGTTRRACFVLHCIVAAAPEAPSPAPDTTTSPLASLAGHPSRTCGSAAPARSLCASSERPLTEKVAMAPGGGSTLAPGFSLPPPARWWWRRGAQQAGTPPHDNKCRLRFRGGRRCGALQLQESFALLLVQHTKKSATLSLSLSLTSRQVCQARTRLTQRGNPLRKEFWFDFETLRWPVAHDNRCLPPLPARARPRRPAPLTVVFPPAT